MPKPHSSFTAFIVATSLTKLAASKRWAGFFSEDMKRLNQTFALRSTKTWVRKCFAMLPLALYSALIDLFYVPGLVHHFLFRKRFIEECTREEIKKGATQVVVLGAGFDTLSLRLAKEYPAVKFFEVDLAPMQEKKLHCLSAIAYLIPENCSFIVGDLTDNAFFAPTGATSVMDKNAPTLVIIEGVLMYFNEAEVKQLFSALHAMFQGPLTIVFGAITTSDAEGSWSLRLINALLQHSNETTQWFCESGKIGGFMSALGYKLTRSVRYRELQRGYCSAEELNAIPEEDENYYVLGRA